jgi:hypothetical protein
MIENKQTESFESRLNPRNNEDVKDNEFSQN